MIKMICDKCNKDCGRNAYDILVRMLHNPTPYSVRDIGDPEITDENTHMRFILCQNCYDKLGFPNIYSIEQKGLKFEGEQTDDKHGEET